RMRSALVVAESALALMLLVASGLFLRSFARLEGVSPGFEPRGVMTAAFWLPQQAYPGGEQVTGFYRAVQDRLSHMQVVAAAAMGNPIPFSGYINSGVFQIEGRPMPPGQPDPHGDFRLVTPGYFAALGISVRRGREFTAADRA